MKRSSSSPSERPIGYHHLDHPSRPVIKHESPSARSWQTGLQDVARQGSRKVQTAAHVKYKALHPLSKAFILSVFLRLDLNNLWKKAFSLRRYFDYWSWCTSQLAFVAERKVLKKEYDDMKEKLEEQIEEGKELTLMQKEEYLTREMLYENYIDGMRKARVFMLKTDKTRRRIVLGYAWVQWQNLVYVQKMAEEQEKLRQDTMVETERQEGVVREEVIRAQREAAAKLAELKVEQMKGLHKIQHILLVQHKRQLRFKCLRMFLHWHIKALCIRYKSAYVNTVDPLRAHIEYQERLLQRVEEDISSEIGRRRSSFKPALIRTGLGERNALKVAAVRLRENKKGKNLSSLDELHNSYSDRARAQAKDRSRSGVSGFRGSKQHHPDMSHVDALQSSYSPYAHSSSRSTNASATTTPFRSRIAKEELASAPTSSRKPSQSHGRALRYGEGMPLHRGSRSDRAEWEHDVYYGMDEVWREQGLQGLAEVKREDEDEAEGYGDEGMGMGSGTGTGGHGGGRIRWDPPDDTSDWWTRGYLRGEEGKGKESQNEKDRRYAESVAAIDLYESILHPHTHAEKAERAKIAEDERKRRVRRLQGALSRAYTDGPAAKEDAAEVARYGGAGRVFRGKHAIESDSSYAASGRQSHVRTTPTLHDFEVSRSRSHLAFLSTGKKGKSEGEGEGEGEEASRRGVQLAISSPVRINDFSIQMNLDIDQLQDEGSICSLESDDYHRYNTDALDDSWGEEQEQEQEHEHEVFEVSARAQALQ